MMFGRSYRKAGGTPSFSEKESNRSKYCYELSYYILLLIANLMGCSSMVVGSEGPVVKLTNGAEERSKVHVSLSFAVSIKGNLLLPLFNSHSG